MKEETEAQRAVDPQAPIVIGGAGGGRTRVLAVVLQRLGFHLGRDRNSSEDSLLGVEFTAAEAAPLARLVQSPASRGRYRIQLYRWNQASIAAVDATGFRVDGASEEMRA